VGTWTQVRTLAFFLLVAALALLGTGADCGGLPGIPRDPMPPAGPDSTWAGAPTVYNVVTTIDTYAIRYVVDWGSVSDTTDSSYASGETAAVAHAWDAPGTVSIRVQAFNAAFPERASNWSLVKSVNVIPDGLPVIDTFYGPPVAVRGVETFFSVFAHDPDGDSIRAVIDWGDSTGTTTGFSPSPCSMVVSHTFWQVETATVVITVQDYRGAPSLPETSYVPVGTGGADTER
jgi:hypothetical protein